MKQTSILTILLFLLAFSCHAELVVTVASTKTTGQKTVIKLSLTNNYKEKVESARAQVFLLDDQGKVVGQSVKWIIGGDKQSKPLDQGATTTYNYVVTAEKPFASTKVTVTRVVLEGGKVADIAAPKGSAE